MCLSKDDRLRLSVIACKTRLGREVTLEHRIWVQQLIEDDTQARGIWERHQR